MSVAKTRSDFSHVLRELAWNQWSQMGVAVAPPARASRRSADPEALLLFSLEAGRDEPRLFDEVLDWLLVNQPSLSVHRLRGLCAGQEDRVLVAAAVDWATRWGPRSKSAASSNQRERPAEPLELFRGFEATGDGMDSVFGAHGLARPALQPSGKSQPADLGRSINFALRLRRLFGVGVKAEVVRALLTIRAPRLDVVVVARSAGFSERNVREALSQLADAAVVDVPIVGETRSYSMAKQAWAAALGIEHEDALPGHFDWVQALRALTKMSRWLNDPVLASQSDYMRASSARTLLDEVASDLRYAGIRAAYGLPPGPVEWTDIDDVLMVAARQVLQATE